MGATENAATLPSFELLSNVKSPVQWIRDPANKNQKRGLGHDGTFIIA
jgi:hypothetical protein